MIIGGLQKSSLIDYPGLISAIIFTKGCNFKCPYCHNPELFENNSGDDISLPQLFSFLKSRTGKLDGVVVTGGEPTLHKDLKELIQKIKALDFQVKLDSNGTNPVVLKELINEKLVDYVAMDIKAPIEKYSKVVCTKVNEKNILDSIEFLKQGNVPYEFRTTVVKSQLSFTDFESIGKMIKGAPKYYLQRFVPTKTLNKEFLSETTYSDEDFEKIKKILTRYVDFVDVR